jgi:hypothetical protein
MNTKTRLKLTVFTALYLGAITLMATIMKLEVIATTSIAGIMTILSAYIWGQTKRPSKYELPDSNTHEQIIEVDSTLPIGNSDFSANHQTDKPGEKSERGKLQAKQNLGADCSAAQRDSNAIRTAGGRE